MRHFTIVMEDDASTEVETTITVSTFGHVTFTAPWGTFTGHIDSDLNEIVWKEEPDPSDNDIIHDWLESIQLAPAEPSAAQQSRMPPGPKSCNLTPQVTAWHPAAVSPQGITIASSSRPVR